MHKSMVRPVGTGGGTTQVSSVMLRSKMLKIQQKKWKLKEPLYENQTECHEIETNP
jgi:hypothetical protein